MALTQGFSDESPILEYSYTAGLGPYILAGAWSTHLPFSAHYMTGSSVIYRVTDGSSADGSQFEIATGIYDATAKTLTRISILASSSAGAPVNWSGRTRLLVRPLLSALPLCATPPTNGQILVWDAAHNEYCPADFCTLVRACLAPAPAPPPPPPPPPTPPGFEPWVGISTYVSPTIPTRSITLSTNHPNEIVIIQVCMQAEGGPAPSVVSVVGGGLTWAKRAGASGNTTNTPSSYYGDSEIWWAIATTPLAGATIDVTVASQLGFITLIGGGVTGIDPAAPWDTDPSLPAYGLNFAAGPALTTVTGISTARAADIALFFYMDVFGVDTISATGPVTLNKLAQQGANQSFIGLGIDAAVFGSILSAQLMGATFTGHRNFPAADMPIEGWVLIADALRAA